MVSPSQPRDNNPDRNNEELIGPGGSIKRREYAKSLVREYQMGEIPEDPIDENEDDLGSMKSCPFWRESSRAGAMFYDALTILFSHQETADVQNIEDKALDLLGEHFNGNRGHDEAVLKACMPVVSLKVSIGKLIGDENSNDT